MATNWRRGLTRLTIMVGVPWCLFWCVSFFDAYRSAQAYEARAIVAQAGSDADTAQAARELAQSAYDQEARAVLFGVALPLVLAMVGGAGLWVGWGFKPSE
jgi:hypothetical protein